MRTPEAVAAMPCPVCKTGLTMSERQGIEIDYCPTCRGVWLDRGELDKIIERSGAQASPPPAAAPVPQAAPPPQQPWGSDRPRDDYRRDPYRSHDDYKRYPKKKKSWLEDIFD